MESIVQSYLSRHFEVKTNEEANTKISWLVYDGIYPKHYDGCRNVISASNLIKELILVFNIKTNQAINNIKEWSVLAKKDVDLGHYWRPYQETSYR
jgi:hypothetical protein